MTDETEAKRLHINPDSLRVVPDAERGSVAEMMRMLGRFTREQRRQVWVALGNDPAIWDAEHKESE